MEQIISKLKNLNLLFAAIIVITIMSCGGETSNQEVNAEGFTVIENELKAKFGADAYYTDLAISYDKSVGNIISVTVTENPESLKMGQWNLMQNSWRQNSEITLEVPKGNLAADFMYQLNDKINLTKLGELIEKSSKQLTAEKDIENPALEMAFIKFPKNGDLSKTEYTVRLEPENGGTSFTFYYMLSGELIKMDY